MLVHILKFAQVLPPEYDFYILMLSKLCSAVVTRVRFSVLGPGYVVIRNANLTDWPFFLHLRFVEMWIRKLPGYRESAIESRDNLEK